jgi:uncharacterized protein YbjQ (UPF0145 family)
MKQAVDDAKQAFDDMIAATRAEFRDAVDTELAESDARRAAIDDLIWNAAAADADAIWNNG